MGSSDPGNMVFIKRCEDYDRKRIEAIVAEGMAHFNYRPHGRVMVKPNVVFAYNTERFGSTAFTATPLVAAVLMPISSGFVIWGASRVERAVRRGE